MKIKGFFILIKKRGEKKKIFWAIIGIILIFLIIYIGVLPLVEATKRMEEEIMMKGKVVQKYNQFLQSRKSIEEELKRVYTQYEEIQKRLIPGETSQLGSATLQEIVKRVADKNGINIRSFKIIEPKEMAPYRKISLQVEINPVNQMLSLCQFFHDIEHHEKFLMISELNLLIFNIRMPNNIQGSMIVSGFMPGVKEKEKGKGDKT